MIIAFMGNDGSGKTATIRLLQQKLITSGSKTIYVPGFAHCFLDKFKQWLEAVMRVNVRSLQNEYGNSARQKANLFFRLWPYLVFLDCLCLLIKYGLKSGRVVLFDRYFYDYIISFRNLKINSWLEEILFSLFPKPRHCYIFDV